LSTAPASLALDLGSTRIKAARIGEDGALRDLGGAPSPPLDPARDPRDLRRENDARSWRAAAEGVLRDAAGGLAAGTPLGIACQRSSFLLWERASGAPATPLISWQDRRAAAWCAARAASEPRVRELTGLPLSPHYAGPKLATLLEADPALAGELAAGRLRFGTLESWLVACWSPERAHRVDLGMAARTLLADPLRGAWSDELLELFGVPAACLPEIRPSAGSRVSLGNGLALAASLADQAASLLAVLPTDADAALINLGTGCFAQRPTGERMERRDGYLSAAVCSRGGRTYFALEGTVNAGGDTLARVAPASPALAPVEDWPALDGAPQAFCLPDENGVGAPFWRPAQLQTFSPQAERLPPAAKRRVVLEGLLFRLADVLADLGHPARVLVSGGLAREPAVASGLATLLGRPVLEVAEQETTLLGVGLLAAGMAAPRAEMKLRPVAPTSSAAWLRTKHARWRSWLASVLARS
jgi:glycerol kinase